jgi:DDE superfamily endonuclease
LIEKVEKYNITGENMYNWDEKGFILGLAHAVKRIMSLYALKLGRIMGASQDGSREFISLLACIYADGTKLPPALIYKGESADLLDSWVADFSEGDEAYFAATSNGWTCDSLGLQWLQKVFHPHTKDKAGNQLRLLIVDGHSSHVNLKFIDWADRHRILIMILPPHSTHRLQPLDVGLFQPLATEYSKQISTLMANGYGYVSMTKRAFWPMFKASWEASFTEKNITNAFAKTSIFPHEPSVVLDKITRPEPPPVSISQERTPMTCRAVRRMHKAYKKSPIRKRLSFIFHANTRLAAQHSIDKHTITGLITSLKHEKTKRRRGKRLNLVGEEDNGPQFFGPSEVLCAKSYASEKEAQEQAERDRIEANKATAAANKVRKEQEKAERAQRVAERRRLAAEKKIQHAVDVQARKELRIAQKAAKDAAKLQRKDRIPPAKITKRVLKPKEPIVVPQNEVGLSQVKITTSRGRTTMRTIQGSK